MSSDTPPFRPIGWWLKHADALLDAAFEGALAGTDATAAAGRSSAPSRRIPPPQPT